MSQRECIICRLLRSVVIVGASVCWVTCAQIATAAPPYFTVLGDLPGGADRSAETAISDDGFFVAGSSDSSNGQEAVLWTIGGGMTGLGSIFTESGARMSASDVSSTGVVTGAATSAWPNLLQEAYVATEASGVVGIGAFGTWSVSDYS